jgi:hypothetical protein
MARAVGMMVYVCYMFVASVSIGLITGSVGFLASLIFVRTIYAAIKID